MILYRKDFSLSESVSFRDYINTLETKLFPTYAFLVEKTSSRENYHAELVCTASIWERGGWRSVFFGGVLLSECELQHSKGKRHFTLQASSKGINTFIGSIYVIFAFVILVVGISAMVAYNTVSVQNVAGLVITLLVMLGPSTVIYLQDKKFLDRIGAFAQEIGRE